MALTKLDYTPYGYTPTAWVCITFIALFSISTIAHLGSAIRFKLWYLIPTAALAGIGEILGWVARYWSSRNVNTLEPFLMQITTTIIAPTPLLAANFVILGRLITLLGVQYSRLTPLMYTVIFVSADTIALVIQSIGGAKASAAAKEDGDADIGGNIMLGGICFQMVAILAYVAVAGEFLFRVVKNRPIAGKVAVLPAAGDSEKVGDKDEGGSITEAPAVTLTRNIKLMLLGLVLSTLFIFIRSVYRTIELTDGWEGEIIGNETLFNVLDGLMILFAMISLNVLHPGWLLPAGTR